MNANQVANQIRSWLDWLAGWVRWAVGILILTALFCMVVEQYGFQMPYLTVSGNANTWIYLAGIYWLSK